MTKIPIALNIIAPSDLLGVYKGRMINIIRLDSNKWLPAVCCTGVRYGPKDVPFFIFESCNVKTLLNANDYGKYWLPVGTPPVKFYGQITKCDMNKFMDEVQELYKTGVFNKVTEDVSELYKTGNFNVTTKTEYGTRRDIKIDDKATLRNNRL